ncbi:MAG TPA: hypothetical protein RMH99_23970 [Sandaracinaceae bacterium LLY-WYZ-13_1]|nr:hypothetical protein [Sandaracinaceae bacterium LLY-WYZ-13_1]
MDRWLAAIALLLTGCTGAQGAAFVPRLVVRGAAVHRRDEGGSGPRERWDWRVEADLRWSLGRVRREPASIAPVAPKVRLDPRGAPACVEPTICAWERRARARALRAIEGAREGEEP